MCFIVDVEFHFYATNWPIQLFLSNELWMNFLFTKSICTANSRAEHLKIHTILDQRPTIIFIYFTVYSNANCLQKLIQAKELNNYDSYRVSHSKVCKVILLWWGYIFIWIFVNIWGPMCSWETPFFAYLTSFYWIDDARHLWSIFQNFLVP